MHRQTAMGELHGDRRRQRGLADAALAHQHHETVAVRGDVVHQIATGWACRARLEHRRSWRTGGATGASSWRSAVQADDIEGLERDLVARQRLQGLRASPPARPFSRSQMAAASGSCAASASRQDAVDDQVLLRQGRSPRVLHGCARLRAAWPAGHAPPEPDGCAADRPGLRPPPCIGRAAFPDPPAGRGTTHRPCRSRESPLQAPGSCSSRMVCPVGAVSKMMWS